MSARCSTGRKDSRVVTDDKKNPDLVNLFASKDPGPMTTRRQMTIMRMSHWKNRPQLVQRGLRRDLAPLGAKALGREQLGRRSGILACPERRAEDGSIGSSKVGRPHSERSGPLVHYHPVPNPFDYENKYPEDAYGEEFGDNARVWKVYMDEAELFDVELTEGWKDTVDVLLVFVCLARVLLPAKADFEISGWSVLRCGRHSCRHLDTGTST